MKFIINKDKLTIDKLEEKNSGSINYYGIETEFDESWNDLTIEAILVKDKEEIGTPRSIIDNKIYIDTKEFGMYCIGFIGYRLDSNNKKIYQISTNLKRIPYQKGAGELETEPIQVPSASEWEIYIAQIQELLEDVRNHANLNNLDFENSGHIGFQAEIEDLNEIRSGAEAGATAVQDDDYIHTDNNFSNEEKEKLSELENYDDTELRGRIATAESDIDTLETSKQDKTDNSLNTTSKTIVGAINELLTSLDLSETQINNILALIPNQASTSNQLSDKDFVNSSIATNTAYFRGTFNSLAELQAYSGEKTLNDYAFVIIYDEVITTQVKQYDRYKYNGISWVFEYTLNNSSFTANQWASIQSGITQDLVQQISTNQSDISGIKNGANINSFGATETALANKVDKITGKGLSTNDYDNIEKAKVTGAEQNSNKVTSISSSSTDEEYPSAKAVYNYIETLDIEEVDF